MLVARTALSLRYPAVRRASLLHVGRNDIFTIPTYIDASAERSAVANVLTLTKLVVKAAARGFRGPRRRKSAVYFKSVAAAAFWIDTKTTLGALIDVEQSRIESVLKPECDRKFIYRNRNSLIPLHANNY